MSETGESDPGKTVSETGSEITSPTALQTADVREREAAEIESPCHVPEPRGWVYQTLFLLSVVQLVFTALSTRYWASLLHWLTVGRSNPIEQGRNGWMHEVLSLTALVIAFLFFALTSGLGVYIGYAWQEARKSPPTLQGNVCSPLFIVSSLSHSLHYVDI